MNKPLLVVNPKSGGGRTSGVIAELRATIERKLGEVDVVLTERSGHAIDLAEAGAREDRELVVAVGGDGTFSEVANGVLRAKKKTRVAFIGQGTGGDFRKTLGIEHRLDKYLDAIASKHERTIDVGHARFRGRSGEEEHYFVNILSAGMGGLVDEYVATGSRALGPTAAYFVASMKALLRGAPATCDVTVDGETKEAPLVHDCSLQRPVLRLRHARRADGEDRRRPLRGGLDGRAEQARLRALLATNLRRRAPELPGVSHFSCERIEIDLENEDARETFRLDVDGEPLGGLPLSIEVMPAALVVRA